MMASPSETEKKHERRYKVSLCSDISSYIATHISASFLGIENGAAVFYNAENYIVRVFAAGTWLEIERID